MARALLCPNCRTRYALADLGPEPTFRCVKCGQILKVPQQVRAPAENNGRGTAIRVAGVPASRPPATAHGKGPRRERRAREPEPVAWPLRLLAWIAALPLGAVMVVVPARRFGLLSGVDLADVIIGTGAGRYARLAVVVLLWALASTILVQLLLVGGRALADRRRAVTGKGRGAVPAPESATARSPRRRPAPAPARAGRTVTARSAQRLRSTAGRRTGS